MACSGEYVKITTKYLLKKQNNGNTTNSSVYNMPRHKFPTLWYVNTISLLKDKKNALDLIIWEQSGLQKMLCADTSRKCCDVYHAFPADWFKCSWGNWIRFAQALGLEEVLQLAHLISLFFSWFLCGLSAKHLHDILMKWTVLMYSWN